LRQSRRVYDLEVNVSEADNQAIQDPFKLGVLSALVVIGKALRASDAVNTEAVMGDALRTISKLPSGDRPPEEQDENTLALRWLVAGLR
jgi:hypothetical protein